MRTTLVDAALVYVVMRVISAGVILLAQRHQVALPGLSRTPYLGMTTHWDALWYRQIAKTGYPRHLPSRPVLHAPFAHQHLVHQRIVHQRLLFRLHHHLPHALLPHRAPFQLHYHLPSAHSGTVAQNQWAFLAGFPFATRALMQLTGMNFAVSASLLNLVAGIVAACAIARVLEVRIPRAATLAVVAVWSALPMAPTLQLAYSEALAMALLALALLWLVREQWGRATIAAVLLGLTRPILLPLVVVYAVAVGRRWWRRRSDPLTPSEWARMLIGLVVTAAGSALWSGIAWWYTGVPDAYVQTEAAWHQGKVSPFAGLVVFRRQISHDRLLQWPSVAVVAAIGLAVVLALLALRSPRLHPVLVTWCWAYLVYNLAVANMHSDELRMLLPLFPLVAVMVGVASTRIATSWRARAVLLTGLGIVGQYAWVMTYVRFIPGIAHAP